MMNSFPPPIYSIIHSTNNNCVLPKPWFLSSWNLGASEGQTLKTDCYCADPITKGKPCNQRAM